MRAYAQRNPINEFKKESFHLFDSMIESFKDDVVKILFNIKIQAMSKEDYDRQQKKEKNNWLKIGGQKLYFLSLVNLKKFQL